MARENKKLISDYIQAGFPMISLLTNEPDRAEERIVDEISVLVDQMKKALKKSDPAEAAKFSMTVYAWDCRRGRRDLTSNGAGADPDMIDPYMLLNWFSSEECGCRCVLLVHNFHRHIDKDMGIIQTLQNVIPVLKTSLRTIIFISPDMEIPIELERIVTELDHPLPTGDEIKEEYTKMIKEYGMEINEDSMNEAVEVAKGLTMFEAESAISLSIVRNRSIDKDTIFEIKSHMIKKNGDLEISTFGETLDDLKGMENLKEFGLDVLSHPFSKGILLLGVSGTGKCLEKGTPVIMYDGETKLVEDIRTGDMLMGPDSLPRNVLGTTSGYGKLFKITPNKGDPYVVNSEHILSLKETGTEDICNIKVTDYIKMVSDTPAKAAKLLGWRCGVNFKETPVPIPAYILGAYLGDGHNQSPRVTNMDSEVLKEFVTFTESSGLFLTGWDDNYNTSKAITLRIVGKVGAGGVAESRVNFMLDTLRDLGVLGNKHIPDIYKYNSRSARFDVLAGLIDTDGSLSCGGYEITTKYESLAYDILFLARSLGFAAYSSLTSKCDSKTGGGGIYHRIFISGDCSQIPVRIKRKKAQTRKSKKDVLKTGITVEPIGKGEYYGFELDGDSLFLLGDFTVTHNSHYAKAIGKSIGLPTVSLSFGNMFDSLVGSSERKIKQALRICDAMSPLLLFIDELEKDLAGAQSSGETDSGVTKRVMKTFLTWLSDHETRVPIIATANSIKYVPPEFLRSERWDAIFFVNIPTEEEADAILSHYLTVYEIGASTDEVRSKVHMKNWTGSEIKALCRLGHIMGGDVEKSSKYVVPIYNAKKAEIDELRSEALQYAIPASGALDNRAKIKTSEPSIVSRKLMGASENTASTVKLAKKKKQDDNTEVN